MHHKIISPALLLAVVLPAAELAAQTVFRLGTEKRVCPEYGTVSEGHILLVDRTQFHFQAPTGWQMSADNVQQRIAFSDPGLTSYLALRVQLDATNVVAEPWTETNVTALVALRFANAKISTVYACYGMGTRGVAVEFEFTDSVNRRSHGRLAALNFTGGKMEITAVSCGDWPRTHVEYNAFLNSLRMEVMPPKKEEN
ncbi:MAG: hypothetical protein WCO56_14550 [Verrucomicrobiota bacterium]